MVKHLRYDSYMHVIEIKDSMVNGVCVNQSRKDNSVAREMWFYVLFVYRKPHI
jgi:hypothetical protein